MSDRTKEAIKVMQHYADGGDVQFRIRDHQGWSEASTPCWDWDRKEYRIKPEPKWVPLDEDGMRALVGKALRHKGCGSETLVTRYSAISNEVLVCDCQHDAEHLLERYEHLDGSPVGRLEGKQ